MPAARDNDYWSASLRLDWNLGDDLVLTSLTSVSEFDRFEGDGTCTLTCIGLYDVNLYLEDGTCGGDDMMDVTDEATDDTTDEMTDPDAMSGDAGAG